MSQRIRSCKGQVSKLPGFEVVDFRGDVLEYGRKITGNNEQLNQILSVFKYYKFKIFNYININSSI